MVLEAAEERVSLQHQMFEENWDVFDSQAVTHILTNHQMRIIFNLLKIYGF